MHQLLYLLSVVYIALLSVFSLTNFTQQEKRASPSNIKIVTEEKEGVQFPPSSLGNKQNQLRSPTPSK